MRRLANLTIITFIITLCFGQSVLAHGGHDHPEDTTNITQFNTLATNEVIVKIDGFIYSFDVPGQLIGERAMVPMRGIFEAFEVNVEWDPDLKEISTHSEFSAIKIKMVVGNKKVFVNEKVNELDVPSLVVSNRTLVPIRFVSETLGAEVTWDSVNRTVEIERRKSNCPVYQNEDGSFVNYRSISVDENRELKPAGEYRPLSEPIYNTANHPGNITTLPISSDETLIQTILYGNGSKYVGTFKNGLRHGKGIFYAHNFVYEGDFFEDYMHGEGKQIYDFGEQYQGQFSYDEYNGIGEYIYGDGLVLSGVWEDGALIK